MGKWLLCKLCEEPIWSNRPRKFCSSGCLSKYRSLFLSGFGFKALIPEADRKLKKRRCKECNEEFYPPNTVYDQQFCSRDCYFFWLSKHRRKEYKIKYCPICGREIPTHRKYCSPICRDKANYLRNHKVRICPICGDKIYDNIHIYCSKECRDSYHNIKPPDKVKKIFRIFRTFKNKQKSIKNQEYLFKRAIEIFDEKRS